MARKDSWSRHSPKMGQLAETRGVRKRGTHLACCIPDLKLDALARIGSFCQLDDPRPKLDADGYESRASVSCDLPLTSTYRVSGTASSGRLAHPATEEARGKIGKWNELGSECCKNLSSVSRTSKLDLPHAASPRRICFWIYRVELGRGRRREGGVSLSLW